MVIDDVVVEFVEIEVNGEKIVIDFDVFFSIKVVFLDIVGEIVMFGVVVVDFVGNVGICYFVLLILIDDFMSNVVGFVVDEV